MENTMLTPLNPPLPMQTLRVPGGQAVCRSLILMPRTLHALRQSRRDRPYRGLVDVHVARVEIRLDQLIVELNQTAATNGSQPEGTNTLLIPWTKTPPTSRRDILLPADPSQQHRRPIRSDTRGTFIAAIAQGRLWLKELVEDSTPCSILDQSQPPHAPELGVSAFTSMFT